MATTILLVRHATHPLVGHVLCGRMPGVQLNDVGRMQAHRLGMRVARELPSALYTSPRERCEQTAAAIGEACALTPRICDALDEIDFGTWSGLAFDRLGDDPAWSHWNTARAQASPPGGESMRQAQERAVTGIRHLHAKHPSAVIVAVSHADVIKAILLYCLGLTLDAHQRIDVDTASISVILIWESGSKLLRLNEGLPG